MHKMNGQSFIAQKWGLNARMGVEHYSAPESNIYSVRVWGRAAWGTVVPGELCQKRWFWVVFKV